MTPDKELDTFYKIDEIFKALSSRARFNIVLELLKKKECNVGTIARELGIPQSTVSQHLTVLKNAGIIDGFRNGTQVYYKVVNDKIVKIIQTTQSASE